MTCATFILRPLKAHYLHTFRSFHLAQGASPKSIRWSPTPHTVPFLRLTQQTSMAGAMVLQSAHIAYSNHYWSEHKALLLHTPTNSATRVNQYCSAHRPIVLHTTLRYRPVPPSLGEGCTYFTRAYIIYV